MYCSASARQCSVVHFHICAVMQGENKNYVGKVLYMFVYKYVFKGIYTYTVNISYISVCNNDIRIYVEYVL